MAAGTSARPAPPDFTEAVRQQAEMQAGAPLVALTPDLLQGPPPPALVYSIVGMDDAQLVRYIAAYRAHMAATWDTRWGVVSALRAMNGAARQSDAGAVRYYQRIAEGLWQSLRTLDQGFESSLESMLRSDQLRRFHNWRSAWLRGALLQQRITSHPTIAQGAVEPD